MHLAHKLRLSTFLPSATQLRQDYLFRGVCDSVGGGAVHGRGGACVAGGGEGCLAGEMAAAADGTHPTGMHSC